MELHKSSLFMKVGNSREGLLMQGMCFPSCMFGTHFKSSRMKTHETSVIDKKIDIPYILKGTHCQSYQILEDMSCCLTINNLSFVSGRTVLSAARRLDLAGRDLTLYLQRLLYDKGYSFSTSGKPC